MTGFWSLGWDSGQSRALERSDIYRQSRSGVVLLVSVDKTQKTLSFGTGFFFSQDGHILTNAHVLEDQARLLVYVPDQGVFPDARTVTIDPDADLAVLHLPQAAGSMLPLSDRFPEEGLDSLVVGFPRLLDILQMGLTLHSTVKPVSVSGLAMGRSRTLGRILPFIETTGVLHAGNSGGPLVHAESGHVVGMVVHSVPYVGKTTDREGSMIGSVLLRADMSYAIPSTVIREWLEDHHLPLSNSDSLRAVAASFPSNGRFSLAPQALGISLFLTGHLMHTIADTLNSDHGFMELAVKHYEKARDLFSDKSVIARNLALAYRTLHRYHEARVIYEELLRQFPADLPLLTETADTWKLLQQDDQAMAIYRTILEHEPCYLDALNGMGRLYLDRHDYAKGAQIFRQAVRCVPTSVYASFYLGESLAYSGLVEEAQAVWKGSLESVTIQSSHEQALLDLMRKRVLGPQAFVSQASNMPSTGEKATIVSQ